MLKPLRDTSPRRIGPWQILARLGSGGMGEVFLGREWGEEGAATHPSRGLVAVKTVRRDLAGDEAFRTRFRRELKLLAAVDGPYTARPAGGDADGDPPWLATGYVAGPTLSQAARRAGPFPETTVRALGSRLAYALRDLHTVGVLHRDLKPANVLLSSAGPQLIDFGIARAQGATVMTATGLMVGTPGYMSPEHVAGSRNVRPASDVFCLASLLCFAATGSGPFSDGPLAAVLHRVAGAEADLTALPDGLRDPLAQCLRVDPDSRPSAGELGDMLAAELPTSGNGPAEPGPVGDWPPPIRDHIAEYEHAVEQLCAAGTPLLPEPAEPAGGHGDDGSAVPDAVADAETAPATPEVPPEQPEGQRRDPDPHRQPTVANSPSTPATGRRRRRVLLAASLALALCTGIGAGAYMLRGGGEDGSDGAEARPGSGVKVMGVSDLGTTDTSGVVPQNPEQRPAGWQPWQASFGGPVMGCSAGPTVIACRRTDGSYEVLSAANGKRLWTADLTDNGPMSLDTISIGPTGLNMTPGNSTEPTVHGDVVVFVSGGRLQVRDALTGALRWETEALGAQRFGTRPVVAAGKVMVTTEKNETQVGSDQVLSVHTLDDGRELWSRTLNSAELSRAAQRPFEPIAARDGLVYAVGVEGIVSYELAGGDQRGQVETAAEDCRRVMLRAETALCPVLASQTDSQPNRLVLHRLDPASLSPRKPRSVLPLKEEGWSGPRVTAVGEGVVVALTRGKSRVTVLERGTGERLGRFPLERPKEADGAVTTSAPLIAGNTVVYADNNTLYTIPIHGDGGLGPVRSRPVEGAPGDRPKEHYNRVDGTEMARERRPVTVLPIGGVVHLVYDHGTVVSLELPTG